ncbi:hypothetical protein ACH4VT_33705 [Streptomyces lydicus]|uniref:hypothetical protein n=1 Tax=Streptomyces lydicus TaxID=47763 RepID=UPI0037B7EF04
MDSSMVVDPGGSESPSRSQPHRPQRRLTSRDVEILAWMGRWRAVTARQVAREFNKRDGNRRLEIYERRMRALHELGLVDHARMLADYPRVHWLTREGLRAVELTGSTGAPKIAELEHDLSVIDLAHHLAEIQPPHTIMTEQEIRRTEPNPAAGPESRLRSDIEMGAGRGTGGRAFPDLASLVDGSDVWVHELERSRKSRPRLTRIMLSYAYAPHIAGVVYWAYPHILAGVQAAADDANIRAERAGREPRIVVRPWERP